MIHQVLKFGLAMVMVVFGMALLTEAVQAAEWQTAPAPTYTAPSANYEWCLDLDKFNTRMTKFEGTFVGGGMVASGGVSVIVFPDNTFGIFIYFPETGKVCNIGNGAFAKPPARSFTV